MLIFNCIDGGFEVNIPLLYRDSCLGHQHVDCLFYMLV